MVYNAALSVRQAASLIMYPAEPERAVQDLKLLDDSRKALNYISDVIKRPLLAPATATTKIFDTKYADVLRIPDLLATTGDDAPVVTAYAEPLVSGTDFLWVFNKELIGYNGLRRLDVGVDALWSADREEEEGLPYAQISITGFWGLGAPLPEQVVTAAARVAVKLYRKENRRHADEAGNEQTGSNSFSALLLDNETFNLVRPYINRYTPQVVSGWP